MPNGQDGRDLLRELQNLQKGSSLDKSPQDLLYELRCELWHLRDQLKDMRGELRNELKDELSKLQLELWFQVTLVGVIVGVVILLMEGHVWTGLGVFAAWIAWVCFRAIHYPE